MHSPAKPSSVRRNPLVDYLSNRASWFLPTQIPKRDDRSINLYNVMLARTGGRPVKLGLIGPNTMSGVGYQSRDLAEKLGIQQWLVVGGAEREDLGSIEGKELTRINADTDRELIKGWLGKVECVLFCESPLLPDLPGLAHSMGIPSICIVNWEWLGPTLPWLKNVDLFLAPNRHTYDLLTKWKRESLPRSRVEFLPGLVDTKRFTFKQREVCRNFIFVNGRGGFAPFIRGFLRDQVGPPRKGLSVVLESARLAPEVPIKIRSQFPIESKLPPNVELLPFAEDNRNLFDAGDIAVQPSFFEGTGLQMIEMMASGLPLITTNAAPMNEFPALDLIDCKSKPGKAMKQIIDVNFPSAAHLARLMQKHLGSDISSASLAARRYAVENHSWTTTGERFKTLLSRV